MARFIGLSQGQFAIVDDDDFDRLNVHKWYAIWVPNMGSFYARRNVSVNGKKTSLPMHREVMGAVHGQQVDHKNHDTLDNRKSELRLCVPSQNQWNSRMRKNNTSGFKGVSLNRRCNRWIATIQAHGKQINLGYFGTAEEAGMAYQSAAKELHGEFAAKPVQ